MIETFLLAFAILSICITYHKLEMRTMDEYCTFQRRRHLKQVHAYIGQAALDVVKEVVDARLKHPSWPGDVVYAAAIVQEESGELMRAAVQNAMEGGTIDACDKEAIQTAATCIRFLERR